jgi:hypothetical protein
MARATLTAITKVLIISLLNTGSLYSCGWYENSESTRLALFRAELSDMSGFRPFYYSAEFYNSSSPDPMGIDKQKNCEEWRSELGKNVRTEDIYKILYQTEPENFQYAFESGRLLDSFPKNTFILKLLQPGNKDFMDYLQLSKELEYYNFKSEGKWEAWDRIDEWNSISGVELRKDYSFIKQRVALLKNAFLKQRYAFQLIKISYYQTNYVDVSNYYSLFFNHNENTILRPWAMLYDALAEDAIGNRVQANYLYSKVFDQCEEKKYVAMQWFNKKPDMVRKTLALAKNDKEKAVILTMAGMRDPGPALAKIKEIAALDPDNKYFAVMVMREINKLEDWIFTPAYTEYGPSVIIDEEWYEFDKIRDRNRKKDLAYSQELKAYLIGRYKSATGELHDFLAVAIAHLSFINDEAGAGKIYLSSISADASEPIIVQKNIQLALNMVKSQDITTASAKNDILQFLRSIEAISRNNSNVSKTLYSLTRLISKAYQERHEGAIAGLFFLRSEHYKSDYAESSGNVDYEDYSYLMNDDYYWKLAYFDRYATIKDMDDLIAMVRNKQKTPFERYLCGKEMKDANPYLDLKATIAFRNNDLSLAEKTLSEIPSVFWDSTYEFSHYLNEDPFLPKRLSYAYTRNFNYHFNKYTFVRTLNKLLQSAEKNRNADSYLKLGHAFYNCSYWGNSWMMTCYGKGSSEEYYYSSDYLFGSTFQQRISMQEGNYFKCTIAEKYYRKALEYAKTDEQKAMCNLMIHCCKEAVYDFQLGLGENSDKIKPFKADKELMDFYTYWNTEVFMKYNCPEMDDYIAKK